VTSSPEERDLTDLPAMLEHVLLRPGVTPDEVDDACAAAVLREVAAT
jgi:hypothetical protein